MTELIDSIYNQFSDTPQSAGSHASQNEAWQAVLAWWRKRTRLERTGGIYSDGSSAQKLVGLLASNEFIPTANQTFIDDLKTVYGYSYEADLDATQVSEILQKLSEDKTTIEKRSSSIKDHLVKSIGSLFAPTGQSYLDYTDAIRNWVSSLHPDQKDRYAQWQQPYTLTLIEALPKMVTIDKTLLEDIPNAPGFMFGKVDEWSYDRSDDYTKRFKDALQWIENGLPKVPPPEFTTSVSATQNAHGEPQVIYHGQVTLTVKAPDGVTVRVTKDQDPRSAKQFEPVGGGMTWSSDIIESCSYYLVSQSIQGEFSKTIKLTFRNLDDDYKLRIESQGKLDPRERFYSFHNPSDRRGLFVILRSLVRQLVSDGLIAEEEIREAFSEALDSELGNHDEV